MHIDPGRLQEILNLPHSYYGGIARRKDERCSPGLVNYLSSQLTPAMRVLDVGCGDGSILLELCERFQHGVGIDNDAEHIQLAEEARRAQGAGNIELLQMDFPREAEWLDSASFDLIFSLRGPLPDTSEGIQEALRLLRPEGMLFCEEIGEQHQREVSEIFFPEEINRPRIPEADRLKAALEAQGVDVRLTADIFDKWIYPDIYAWFQYICNLWTWLGAPLPEPDDPRIALFAEHNTNAAGEIVTTHHVVWAAGVKQPSGD